MYLVNVMMVDVRQVEIAGVSDSEVGEVALREAQRLYGNYDSVDVFSIEHRPDSKAAPTPSRNEAGAERRGARLDVEDGFRCTGGRIRRGRGRRWLLR